MRKICFAILLMPALAWAQPKDADGWRKEGSTQYNLGNFDKAIEAFKQGFAVETDENKKSSFLYSIAQAYRQMNDCKNAQFFYRRFLALRDADPSKPLSAKTRKEIEDRIADLEECVQISKRPPNNISSDTGTEKPGGDGEHKPPPKDTAGTESGTDGGGDDDDDDSGGSVTRPAVVGQPRTFSARFTGGLALVNAGDLDIPPQFALAITAGYPIPLSDKLAIDVGAAFTFSPVPDHIMPNTPMEQSQTVNIISAMANAGATFTVAPKINLRGDLGLGVLGLFGVSQTNFTDGAETSGALSMFHVRIAASGDYAITPNWVVGPTVAFSYSPAKDGLREDISSITAIDIMVGVGYRM